MREPQPAPFASPPGPCWASLSLPLWPGSPAQSTSGFRRENLQVGAVRRADKSYCKPYPAQLLLSCISCRQLLEGEAAFLAVLSHLLEVTALDVFLARNFVLSLEGKWLAGAHHFQVSNRELFSSEVTCQALIQALASCCRAFKSSSVVLQNAPCGNIDS